MSGSGTFPQRPYGGLSGDGLVDHVIGDAYPNVKYVAENLPAALNALPVIANTLEEVTELEASAEASAASALVSKNSATNSQGIASTAAVTATTKAAEALASANLASDFVKHYYGASDTEPELRPNGDAMQPGDLYYDTLNQLMKVFTGEEWDDSPFEQIEPISIINDYAATENITLPNPVLSLEGNFIVDGVMVENDETVFLPLQTNAIQNGSYIYNATTNTLSRFGEMLAGQILRLPTDVFILAGDDNFEVTYYLASPATVIVGTTASVWSTESEDPSYMQNGTFKAGSVSSSASARVEENRRIFCSDMPSYGATLGFSYYPRSLWADLNPFAYVSRYITSANPGSHVSAINRAIQEHSVIIFDRTFYLKSQITENCSNKTLIFLASGADGVNRINMLTQVSSLFDFSNQRNIAIKGDLVVDYFESIPDTVKVIKGDNVTNLSIERLVTKGAPFALSMGGTINGLNIGSIKVADLNTEVPFRLGAESAPTSSNNKLGFIEGKEIIENSTLTAAKTYRAWNDPDILIIDGAMSANRIITMSVENATQGKKALISHQATGGFTITINDSNNVLLKAITFSQKAEVILSGGLWKLIP